MSHAFSIKTMWRSFFCALMATFTLSVCLYHRFVDAGRLLTDWKAMNPFRTGKLVLFQVTYDRDWHFFEITFFVILGIFGVSMRPFSSYRSIPPHDLTNNSSSRVYMVLLSSNSIYKLPPFVESI